MDIQILGSSSKGNAYLVDIPERGCCRLLLEAGMSWSLMQKLSDYELSNLDACLISHEHGDHAKAAKEVMRHGIDVYTSRGTAEALGLQADYRCHVVKPNETVTFYPGIEAMALPVEHDAAEPFAWLIRDAFYGTDEMLLFATDTPYLPYNIPGLTHAMVEANYSADLMNQDDAALNRRVMRSHMSIDALERWLETGTSAQTLQQIWLLHLSDDRSDAEQFKRRIQAASGAAVYID